MDGFALATPDYVLRVADVDEVFDSVAAAAAALRAGRVRLIAGALAFAPGSPAALMAGSVSGGPLPVATPLPPAQLVREIPSPDEHRARVAHLIGLLSSTELRKVVAARSVVMEAADPIEPLTLLAHLVARHPTASGYAVDLSASGRVGETLVGASPEVLVRLRGDVVTLHPLAGTAARGSDRNIDEQQAEKLLASVKNREEHAYVVDWIRERLGPLCVELTIPNEPVLASTRDVWHLATPITGRLRETATALELAELLHPTPAVGGTPTDAALRVIAETEEDRGFYGGAVGWCDHTGDGDWIVAIRCAQVSADGRMIRAFAGGGIVLGSDPDAELEETTVKLRTLLSPLRVNLR